MSILSKLSAMLEIDEATRLGAELMIGKPIGMAIASITESNRNSVRTLLEECVDSYPLHFVGDALMAMGIMGKSAATNMDLVWSGPTPDGAMGRRTWPLAQDQISRAKEFIYAATYSAGAGSPYLQQLKDAIGRGISVTCLVDPHHLLENAIAVREVLQGATLLAMVKDENLGFPYMHSKFLVIDGRITFITSANFSKAGADRNLETGILIRGEQIAGQIKNHVNNLCSSGDLVIWSPK